MLGPKGGAALACVGAVLEIASGRNGRTRHAPAASRTFEGATISNPVAGDGVNSRVRRRVAPEHKFLRPVGVGEPGNAGAHETNKAGELPRDVIALSEQ